MHGGWQLNCPLLALCSLGSSYVFPGIRISAFVKDSSSCWIIQASQSLQYLYSPVRVPSCYPDAHLCQRRGPAWSVPPGIGSEAPLQPLEFMRISGTIGVMKLHRDEDHRVGL